MRLKSPTTLNLKTRIIGILLIVPLIAVISALFSSLKIGILDAIAAGLAGVVAFCLLAAVFMMAYLGVCLLTGKE